MARLPPDILYPILNFHILSSFTSPQEALSLRLVSRAVNHEVMHQLFVLRHLDAKLKQWRKTPPPCVLAHRATIRPEQRGMAMSRITLQQWLSTWLQLERKPDDMCAHVWRQMNAAIDHLDKLSGAPLDGMTLEEQRESTKLHLCDALITLFGIRDTWAYFGPVHDTCQSPSQNHHRDRKRMEFWSLITMVYIGNLEYVTDALKSLYPTSNKSQQGDDIPPSQADQRHIMKGKRSDARFWLECLAAVLTIGVRVGHEDMVKFPLRGATSKRIFCQINFWDQRSVLGTLFATTAHQDRHISQLAITTTRHLLDTWQRDGLRVSEHNWIMEHSSAALDIPTSSKLLLDVLSVVSPRQMQSSVSAEIALNLLGLYLLCQAAVDSDIERAKIALQIMPKDLENLKQSRPWINEHAHCFDHVSMSDEYGVRPNRLFDILNPIRIAAALSHLEILEWLLTIAEPTLSRLNPLIIRDMTRPSGVPKRSEAHLPGKGGLFFDNRQETVHHVFLDQMNLPKPARTNIPNTKVLALLLTHSKDLKWTREAMICSGKCTNIEILTLFLDNINLDEPCPPQEGLLHPLLKHNLFISNPYSAPLSLGSILLQHALAARNLDNAKLLLSRGVRLDRAVRAQGYFQNDAKARNILVGIAELDLPGVMVVARSKWVFYSLDESSGIPVRLKEAMRVEGWCGDVGFTWTEEMEAERVRELMYRIADEDEKS